MSKKPNAVVLLSGGLDSTTTVAIAKSEGFSVHALTFRYGQRHEAELTASRQVAQAMGVQKHVEAEIDLRLFFIDSEHPRPGLRLSKPSNKDPKQQAKSY